MPRIGSLSINLNMWNPIYALAPFVLLMVTIPLAIFATTTTIIAISLLAIRASLVYIQLAIALVGAWLYPLPLKPKLLRHKHSPPSDRTSPTRAHNRTSSTNASSRDKSVWVLQSPFTPKKSGSLTSLFGSGDIMRDFEGVGGWREPREGDDEATWTAMNSRLELPGDVTPRRHRRSLTGSSISSQRWTWSPEQLRMSPVQSRARTPVPIAGEEGADYFPPMYALFQSPKDSATDMWRRHKRRQSGSGSSASSTTSGLMLAMKEAGE